MLNVTEQVEVAELRSKLTNFVHNQILENDLCEDSQLEYTSLLACTDQQVIASHRVARDVTIYTFDDYDLLAQIFFMITNFKS